MLNHKIGKLSPIDENNPLRKMLGKIPRLGAKGRSGDEHTLGRSQADEAPDEGLHVGTTDSARLRVTLCLHVHSIKAETVFVDDAIDTAIAGASSRFLLR